MMISDLFLISAGAVNRIFYNVVIFLNAMVYWLFDTMYKVFIVISNARIFTNSTFSNVANRIYAVIGIVMLFIIAFQLLTNIVDPDKMTSGDQSTGAIVKRIITSLIIIVLLPTAFKYMYKIQDLIFKENIIGNIILGSSGGDENSTTMGSSINNYVFSAFITVVGHEDVTPDVACASSSLTFCEAYNMFNNPNNKYFGDVLLFNRKLSTTNGDEITRNFRKQVAIEIDNGEVEFKWFISLIAAGLCAYIMASFCIDMGVRVAKLAYYQLISPIPVAFRIIPKQQSVFDNWLKSLTGVYLEVFIRLVVVYFCAFLISKLDSVWANVFSTQAASTGINTWIVSALAKVVVIMGILLFMKEAPKLICETFGIKGDGMSLGIGKKLGGMAVFGTGQPLSRENIARKVQNQRLANKEYKKSGAKSRLAWNLGRAADKATASWGFGTRASRAGDEDEIELAAQERELARLENDSQEAQLDQRQSNNDAATTARTTIMDTAKERIMRGDNPNGIVVDYGEQASALESETAALKKQEAAETDIDKKKALQEKIANNESKIAKLRNMETETKKAGMDGKSYTELKAIYDSESSTAETKALAQKAMYDLTSDGNCIKVANQELDKEMKVAGSGAVKIVSAAITLEDLAVNGSIGSVQTGTLYEGHVFDRSEIESRQQYIRNNAGKVVSDAVTNPTNPYNAVVDYAKAVAISKEKMRKLRESMAQANANGDAGEVAKINAEMANLTKEQMEFAATATAVAGTAYEGMSYDELEKAKATASPADLAIIIKLQADLLKYSADEIIEKEQAKVVDVGTIVDTLYKKNITVDQNDPTKGVAVKKREIARQKAEVAKKKAEIARRKEEQSRINQEAADAANKGEKPRSDKK